MKSKLLFLVILSGLVLSTTVTITDVPGFSSRRFCARTCFWDDMIPLLLRDTGCDQTLSNECMCRADLMTTAEVALSNCASNDCNGATLDINSAVSFYDAYCTSNGFTKAAINEVTTTQGSSTQTTSSTSQPNTTSQTTTQVAAKTTTFVQSTASSGFTNAIQASTTLSILSSSISIPSNSSTKSGNGLTTAEIVGIVISILGFLGTCLGVCVQVTRHRWQLRWEIKNY